MEINWCISQHDIDRMKKLFEELNDGGEAEVHKREKTNLPENKTRVTPTAFWHKMVSARITTQNRSGSGSRVDELSNFKPFPLSLRKVRSEGKVERFIARTVQDWGIGKNKDIAKDLATNLDLLEKGEWEKALEECNRLTTLTTTTEEREVVTEERRVATYIDETFRGFGPKQSRNLLQMLGLTRYEIPIDSRLIKWLNEFDFPVELNAGVLSDKGYYEFVSDGIQELCQKANKYPCIFDAAVFASQAPHTRRSSR